MTKTLNPFNDETYPPFDGMPNDAITFFRQLKRNNNREWFEKNKTRFENSVKRPFLSLLHDLGEKMKRVDSSITLDPKRSIYRLYRDVRFSKDKSPYKLWVAGSFTFQSGNRNSSPGYYLHIAGDEAILAGGLYMPEPDQLKKLREQFAQDPGALRSILSARSFKKTFGALQGEVMKRPPRGYEPDHPAIDLLLRKQFIAWATLAPEEALKPKFLKTAVDAFTAVTPLVRYLYDRC